jgi:hypothetical protein
MRRLERALAYAPLHSNVHLNRSVTLNRVLAISLCTGAIACTRQYCSNPVSIQYGHWQYCSTPTKDAKDILNTVPEKHRYIYLTRIEVLTAPIRNPFTEDSGTSLLPIKEV